MLSVCLAQPSLPIFKRDSYDFWSIKMMTLFKSLDIWDLVEQGYIDLDDLEALSSFNKPMH